MRCFSRVGAASPLEPEKKRAYKSGIKYASQFWRATNFITLIIFAAQFVNLFTPTLLFFLAQALLGRRASARPILAAEDNDLSGLTAREIVAFEEDLASVSLESRQSPNNPIQAYIDCTGIEELCDANCYAILCLGQPRTL